LARFAPSRDHPLIFSSRQDAKGAKKIEFDLSKGCIEIQLRTLAIA
jgi:hypothetical protein